MPGLTHGVTIRGDAVKFDGLGKSIFVTIATSAVRHPSEVGDYDIVGVVDKPDSVSRGRVCDRE